MKYLKNHAVTKKGFLIFILSPALDGDSHDFDTVDIICVIQNWIPAAMN
tara:strand:+ start:5119 stop:5265 length:147 start_codon:yes stop_codon:yes gene_type:complete